MAISHFTLVEHSLSKTEILGKKLQEIVSWDAADTVSQMWIQNKACDTM